MVRSGTGLACLFSSEGFCVNLQKEVTAGCFANWDISQWGSLTLEYESLQISRVFSSAHTPSPPSSPSPFFLFLFNPPLVCPPPPKLSSLSSSLLSPHHSLSGIFFLWFSSVVELGRLVFFPGHLILFHCLSFQLPKRSS